MRGTGARKNEARLCPGTEGIRVQRTPEGFHMKRVVSGLIMVAAVFTCAAAEPPAAATQAAPQKVIKDPAEYNSYITALNTQDPASRGAAMEAFVTQYP